MTDLAFLSPSKSLFWTAAVADTRAMTTDDPLGLEYITQQVGLMMLPTFTTRSSRAQAYAMVLYGLRRAGGTRRGEGRAGHTKAFPFAAARSILRRSGLATGECAHVDFRF